MQMTREFADAAARDAANARMRKAGRKAWNDADWNVAVRTFNRLWPLEAEFMSQGLSAEEAKVAAAQVRK